MSELQLQSIQTAVQDVSKRDVIHKMLSDLLINVTDKVFQGRDLYIDGYRFINCVFEKCDLHALRGTFEFHHCILRGGKNYFEEEALKAIRLYNMNPPDLVKVPGFKPKNYPDGRISVTKDIE